ncbi:MAG: hypothetical protein AB3X41_07850 [Leptothrix ochracea]|uniref:hypothetical protein n=1 Tax=Leptothrix ochracea TaxID=735331 RepID=UPI0034E1D391
MSDDMYAKRRRAAFLTFSDLSHGGLIDALWEIDESLNSERVLDVIRVVDKIAKAQQISLHDTKLLYAALFAALKKHDDELPPDPWPMMAAERPDRARSSKRAVKPVAQSLRVEPGVGVVMPPMPPAPLASPPPLPSPPPPSGGQMWEFVDIA